MINTSLLIFSPTLQDLLVDKLGVPLKNGTIYLWQDNNRTTFKNWYYLSGAPGSYTYITLPNPLTLDAAGTISDTNGNDVIPGFYPVSETDNITPQAYFIQVFDQYGQLQFTRQNFPINSASALPPVTTGSNLQNYIINNNFWRNIGTQTFAISGVLSAVVAPSQHDTFSMPDIQFVRDVAANTDIVTFNTFPLTTPPSLTVPPTFIDDVLPEYYLNHQCTTSNTGETYKYYQFPICLHVLNLDGVTATFTIQAQAGTGNVANSLSINIFQFLGSGVVSSASFPIGTVALTPAWNKTVFSFTFPTTIGQTLSATADDALYLQIGIPINAACNINFTLPSIYLGLNASTNSFATYDQVDTVINSPRTGDVRTSLNNFSPFGWIAANDGTIGNIASMATSLASPSAWPLYSLIWNNVSDTYAPVTGGRGANALADFNANKKMQLTLALGRVFTGTATGQTALGTTAGAATATLGIANMPAHTHTTLVPSGAGGQIVTAGGNAINNVSQGVVSSSTGSGTAFSLIQPTTYYNVFFKL